MTDFFLVRPDHRLTRDAIELVVAGLTHDVRGALSGIKLRALTAAVDLAEGDASSVQQSLERIDRVVGWISELCEDLLECARSQAASGPELVRFDLAECMSACVVEQFADAERGRRAPELSLQTNVWIFSHPRSVERILVNLVRNAQRHCPGGNVLVSLTSDGQRASITVRDEGCGIAPDALERLLAPYQRGEQGDASSPSFGLGLWIVSSLAASLGGAFEVRSELGVGTSMGVSLPLVQLRATDELAASQDSGTRRRSRSTSCQSA